MIYMFESLLDNILLLDEGVSSARRLYVDTKKIDKETFDEIVEAVTFLDKTDLPLYDQMMKNPEYYRDEKGMEFEIIDMPPQTYIDLCVEGFWNRSHHIRRQYNFDKEKIRKHIEGDRERTIQGSDFWKKEDHEFYMPVLEFGRGSDFAQEGLHRALLARDKKVNEIPVFVMFNNTNKEEVKRKYNLK